MIIDGGPLSHYEAVLALLAIWAEGSLNLVVFQKVHSVDVFTLESELVSSIDQLNFVWDSVSTEFITIEEVYVLGLLVDVEVPHSEYLFSKAMHWLVCFNLGKWVDVVQQAKNCQ